MLCCFFIVKICFHVHLHKLMLLNVDSRRQFNSSLPCLTNQHDLNKLKRNDETIASQKHNTCILIIQTKQIRFVTHRVARFYCPIITHYYRTNYYTTRSPSTFSDKFLFSDCADQHLLLVSDSGSHIRSYWIFFIMVELLLSCPSLLLRSLSTSAQLRFHLVSFPWVLILSCGLPLGSKPVLHPFLIMCIYSLYVSYFYSLLL